MPAGARARPLVPGTSRASPFNSPYAMTRSGKPPCQNMYSQAVLWGPAPSRPVGENRPGKVSACETAMKAVSR